MNDVWRIFEREWRALFADRTIRLVMIAVPLFYFLLVGWLYSAGKVTEIPIAVVDQDRSALSRELARAFEQDQSLRVAAVVASEPEAARLLDAGDVAAAVVLPPRLEASIKTGREAAVLALIDGANMMIANNAMTALNRDIKTVSAAITLRKLAAAAPSANGQALYTGIDYRYRLLYNPTLSYLEFMAFGIGAAVLQQVVLLGVSLAATREKAAGTWERTLRETPWPALLAGKVLPYVIVGTTMMVVCVTLLLHGFGVPAHGPLLPFLLTGLAFNVAVGAVGLALSFAFSSQLQATQIAMLIATPSFLLSGFTWPFAAMPPLLAGVASLLPLTYFVDAFRQVVVKGRGLEAIGGDLAGLLAITAVAVVAVWLLAKRQAGAGAAGCTASRG
ncbi:Inner membrane transport permease YbhR [compost metagenome]